MAFSFANVAAGLGSSSSTGAVQVHDGAELQEIQTDQLGFSSVNREAKVKLLKTPWSSQDLLLPSASLLSVASSQGLVAAAGPDALVICTTEQVRTAFQENSSNELRDIEPLLTIPHQRLTHVAFSADESVLVVTSSDQGEIVAYQADQLKNGQGAPALQLSTSQTALRALIPNPAVASAQYFAAVTVNGELMIADLGNNTFKQGANGPILATNVTCVSWSNKGKQLVAGLGDGTALQLKPDGSTVASIPRSTIISDNVHISSITWLENDSFFIIYTPNQTATDDDSVPPSEYYIVSREQSNYTFSKLPEVVPAFGVSRTPTHHFVTRLRGWKPYLDDMLVLAATTSIDTGILSKTTKPLNNTDPVTNIFTCTTIDDDGRRANLPLSITEEPVDTSPIGMALDLSATEKVTKPIPSDEEILETDGPMPNLMILNNEGVLCSWWIIYNDAVREKTTFSGFASLNTMHEARSAASPPPEAPSTTMTPMNAVAQTPASAFAPPSTSFGANTTQPSFGNDSGFGSVSKIGENRNSWTSTGFGTGASSSTNSSGFGQPAFGGPSVIGSKPSFGTAGFGQTGFGQSGFGQSGFSQSGLGSGGFGSAVSSAGTGSSAQPKTSGFASFSSGTGFAAAADSSKTVNSGSPFGNLTGPSSFGQGFGSTASFKSSPFGAQKEEEKKPGFSSGSSFKAPSIFKKDESTKINLTESTKSTGFGFGNAFANTLADPEPVLSSTRDTEADMEDEKASENGSINEAMKPEPQSSSEVVDSQSLFKPLITPPSTISQPKTTPAPPVSSLFNPVPQETKTPQPFGSTAWSLGNQNSTTPKDTPAAFKTLFGTKPTSESTPAEVQKSQPTGISRPTDSRLDENVVIGGEANQSIFNFAKPNGTSKTEVTYEPAPRIASHEVKQQPQASPTQSVNLEVPNDAPLPPDFIPANKTAAAGDKKDVEPPGLDSDRDEGEISEGYSSGPEDMTGDISPENERIDDQDDEDDNDELEEEDNTEQIQTSPESSHKEDDNTTSPTGGLFTKVSANQANKASRGLLFGEIGSSAPSFPPPKPQESPRSPSPMRNPPPETSKFRPEVRSFSAPAQPRSAISQRKTTYAQSAIAAQAAKAREEEAARERTRLEVAREARELADAAQSQQLEDDEDSRIQRELAEPVVPSEKLDSFITYEIIHHTSSNKNDIPAQIERLYQDINSMIYTLGINARSLSSFLMYQKGQTPNASWPSVLRTETPLDALNDEWFLEDIEKLHLGCATIERMLDCSSVQIVQSKLESSHGELIQDLSTLRHKISAYRKSTLARAENNSLTAPLSAEQSSVQQELRKACASFHTNLVKIEGEVGVLRARLSEIEPARAMPRKNGDLMQKAPKKPTFEAVAGTVVKMTSMVEKKSADLDVLELQLKRLGIGGDGSSTAQPSVDPSTPSRNLRRSQVGTPGSMTSSIYHSAGSKFGGSLRGTPARNKYGSKIDGQLMVSAADRERWQAKAQRKKVVTSMLRNALEERNKVTPTS